MDLRSALGHPKLYLLSQWVLGAKRARKALLAEYAELRPDMKVLDIGCGPGYVLDYLPSSAEYFGFDPDHKYIAYARKIFSDRAGAHFFDEELRAERLESLPQFDLVMLNGVLHHLDDNVATEILRLSHSALVAGGSLLTLDGCYQEDQSRMAKWLLDHDRGQFVRQEEEYVKLARSAFDDVTQSIRKDLFHVPYTSIIMKCIKEHSR